MIRYRLAVGLLGCAVLLGCRLLSPVATGSGYVWQDTVDALVALQREARVPEHLKSEEAVRTGDEFDVTAYFTVLTHLSPEAGHVLDYVYAFDFMGGFPVLYVRVEDTPPYPTLSAYSEAHGVERVYRSTYLEQISIDGTAEGFFEYVVLAIHGGQFYLHWHANYNDTMVVSSREAVRASLERHSGYGNPLMARQRRQALRMDLEPRVTFEDTAVRVRVVTFTKWGGFYEEVFTISREAPHRILEHERQQLVPYDCGIVF